MQFTNGAAMHSIGVYEAKGGGTRATTVALAPLPPILDLCTQTLCTNNRLLHSLSRQPLQSYFRSAASVKLCTYQSSASLLHTAEMISPDA